MISSIPITPPLFPLSGTLAAVEEHIPGALVSPSARAQIEISAAAIPAAAVHNTFLECRLTAEDRVDLIVGIDVRGREALTMPTRGQSTTDATRLRSFGLGPGDLWRHWTDPRSILRHHVERLWLEFDADRSPATSASEPTEPVIFAELRQDATQTAGYRRDLVFNVANHLAGQMFDPGSHRAIGRCLAALPAGAAVRYLGSLAARGQEVARLSVIGLRRADVLTYLRAIAWPGSLLELRDQLADTWEGSDSQPEFAVLNLDVGKEIRPALGLEFRLERRCQTAGRIAETGWIQSLVAQAYCTPLKALALSAWPGCSRAVLPHELWPSVICRRVNHFKLTYRPGQPAEWKAYLSFSHRPASKER